MGGLYTGKQKEVPTNVDTPVSYTHLDVYKRQILDHKAQAVETGNIGNLVAVGNGGGSTCLLYTSRCV